MLPAQTKSKMIADLMDYKKAYLDTHSVELDESATRLLVNHFLTDVLDYRMEDEINTEYMIRGIYADYVVEVEGKRQFVVVVKALPHELSLNDLKQAITFAATEGINQIVLTNARQVELYRIIAGKPVDCIKEFSLDLGDLEQFDENVENLQFLHRGSVFKTGF